MMRALQQSLALPSNKYDNQCRWRYGVTLITAQLSSNTTMQLLLQSIPNLVTSHGMVINTATIQPCTAFCLNYGGTSVTVHWRSRVTNCDKPEHLR